MLMTLLHFICISIMSSFIPFLTARLFIIHQLPVPFITGRVSVYLDIQLECCHFECVSVCVCVCVYCKSLPDAVLGGCFLSMSPGARPGPLLPDSGLWDLPCWGLRFLSCAVAVIRRSG